MKEKEFDPNVIDDSEFERLDKSLDKKDNRNRQFSRSPKSEFNNPNTFALKV